MFFFIHCFITLLVLVAANRNPQTTMSSSLTSGPKFGDRLKTPELTLYLTRDVVKALQDVKLPKKSAPLIKTSKQNSHKNDESYNEGQKIYDQQSQPEKSLKKSRGFVSRFFLPNDKDVIENQDEKDVAKFYLESLKIQKDRFKHLQNSQQNNNYNEEGKTQTNVHFLPYTPFPYQEEILLQQQQQQQQLKQQLKQQWTRILDHNRAELQGLSASRHQNEDNSQTPPILIHSELRITKHHPVPIYKLVDVPVPIPVMGVKVL